MFYLRKLMSNIFFLKYFIINYALNFVHIMLNEKFPLTRNIDKSENTMILRVR